MHRPAHQPPLGEHGGLVEVAQELIGRRRLQLVLTKGAEPGQTELQTADERREAAGANLLRQRGRAAGRWNRIYDVQDSAADTEERLHVTADREDHQPKRVAPQIGERDGLRSTARRVVDVGALLILVEGFLDGEE